MRNMINRKYVKESLKFLLRSRPVIRRYIREVESLYQMSPDELRARNERRFLEIFKTAFNKSPFYHKFYGEAGIGLNDIKSLEDIKKLPVLTKDMVKAHGPEMLTTAKWNLVSNHSSGTTGTPLTVWESWPSLWREQAYLYCYRKRCGFTYGQPLVSLRGNLDRKETHLFVGTSNTLFLSSYNINANTAKLYYDLVDSHKPVAIEGYPSSLYSLALVLRDAGLRLNVPIAFTSSETLLDFQRDLIGNVLGTNVFDHYGMTERCIMLCEAFDHNGYFEAPGYSINEYLPDGELCTSLINDAFPLIRYKCNDVVHFENGNSKKRISGIQGRVEDFVTTKDGSKIQRLDHIFKGVNHVQLSQLIMRKDGVLSINLVPEQGFNAADESKIKENIENRLGRRNIDYCINKINHDEIRLTKAGKFKFLINLKNND